MRFMTAPPRGPRVAARTTSPSRGAFPGSAPSEPQLAEPLLVRRLAHRRLVVAAQDLSAEALELDRALPAIVRTQAPRDARHGVDQPVEGRVARGVELLLDV